MIGAQAPYILSYDGSFVGFLCAAAETINIVSKGLPAPAIKGPASPGELFDESLTVRSDRERARRLWRRIARRAGQEASQEAGQDGLHHCLEAFCSDHAGKEDAIAHLLRRLSREGKSALCDLNDPAVCLVEKASLRTRNQAHLVTGLLRFSELADGSWYALIAPDCEVLPLIARHFAARFSSMAFTIYDKRHAEAMFHRPGEGWAIATGVKPDGDGVFPLSERERAVREGWAEYFSSVAIAQRKNPRLQASHMPKKYWPLLPEMGAEGLKGI